MNAVITRSIGKVTAKLMLWKDKRVTLLSELLKSMKGLKMLGLEKVISNMAMRYGMKTPSRTMPLCIICNIDSILHKVILNY